jgi:hypothetical protein
MILNQKQEDSLTGTWTTVDALLKQDLKATREALYYGVLVLAATVTLSLKGSCSDLMLAASLISAKHFDVGAIVATTTHRGQLKPHFQRVSWSA